MDSARLERQRALARERMRRRRADSAVRARESAAKRRRREANPEVRKKATEAKRRQRQANPDLVRKEAEARRLRRLANPERRKKASHAKRRKDNPELRNKEPQVKRTWWRQGAEQSRERPEFPLTEGAADGRFERDDLALIYVCIPYSVDKRTAVQRRGSMLLELTPAAEHVPPHLVRKGNSLTQCKVPVVSKSSQADFKPRSRSVGVQAQQGKKIPAKLQVTRDRKALQSYSAKPLHTEYYPKVTQHRGLKVRYGGKVQQLKGYLQPNAQHLKQLTSLSGFGKSSSPGIRIPLLDLSDALSGTLLP
ncbi:uncharacterized protein LOC144145874 isoform X1 [Haemaphysalis longicornis]